MNLRINNKDMPLPKPYPIIPQQPRQKPMKILALGLSRTGTLSLWAALNQLGYTTYHGFEACFDNANGSLDFWNAAIAAKEQEQEQQQHQRQSQNKPPDSSSPDSASKPTPAPPKTALDFDRVLWRYDALTDTPCVLFASELLLAYPKAKVILTYRDPDSWVASMQRSYYAVLNSRGMQIMKVLDPGFLGKYYAMGMGSLRAWAGGVDGDVNDMGKLREGYVAHYELMREVVPKERMLEWHPREGWGPLCRFLGKEVPEGEFPNVNQGDWVKELHEKMLVFRLVVVVGKVLGWAVPLVVVGVAWRWGWLLR